MRIMRICLPLVALFITLILVACPGPVNFDNPYDVQNPESPLAAGLSITEFSVSSDNDGNLLANVAWESVSNALQYGVRIESENEVLYEDVFLETTATGVSVPRRDVYRASVRYQVEVEYRGSSTLAWSPYSGDVTFEAGDDPGIAAPTAGLIAEYTMDQVSGSALIDSVGNNDGEIIGAQQEAGFVGSALRFDGSASDRVRVVDPDVPAGDSARSVSAWIRPAPGVGQIGNIAAWGDGLSFNRRWSVLVIMPGDGDGVVEVIGESNDVASPAVVPEGVWTHVAVTYDGSLTTIYVDGAEIVSQAPPAGLYDTDPAQPLMIGTNTENRNDEYYSGLIDELRIYDRALSTSEVQGLAGVSGDDDDQPQTVDGGELFVGDTVTHEFSGRGETVLYSFGAQWNEEYSLVIDDEFSGREAGADPIITITDGSAGSVVYVETAETPSIDKVANPVVFRSDRARNIQDGTIAVFMTVLIESDNPEVTSFELTLRHSGPLVSTLTFPDPEVQGFVDSVADATTRVGGVTNLDLLGSSATDLSGIEQLSSLEAVIINALSVADLSPLASLTYLGGFSANFSSISDITVLDGKEFLTSVEVASTGVTDLSPLAASPLLETVWAFSTAISDLTPLASADRLRQLQIEDTNVADLSPVFNNAPPLEQLYANRLGPADQALVSVAGIGNLTSLTRIDLAGNTALNGGVAEIAGLPNLDFVTLQGSTNIPAADVTAIEDANAGNTGFRLIRPNGSEFNP